MTQIELDASSESTSQDEPGSPPSDDASKMLLEEESSQEGSSRKTAEENADEKETAKENGKRKRRRQWTVEEDAILKRSMLGCGEDCSNSLRRISWLGVARLVPGRTSKQCRDRWLSIRPTVVKREWTREEDAMLIALHGKYKNGWVKIAACFKGRNDNMIKSRFRALTRMGLIKKEDIETEASGSSEGLAANQSTSPTNKINHVTTDHALDSNRFQTGSSQTVNLPLNLAGQATQLQRGFNVHDKLIQNGNQQPNNDLYHSLLLYHALQNANQNMLQTQNCQAFLSPELLGCLTNTSNYTMQGCNRSVPPSITNYVSNANAFGGLSNGLSGLQFQGTTNHIQSPLTSDLKSVNRMALDFSSLTKLIQLGRNANSMNYVVP